MNEKTKSFIKTAFPSALSLYRGIRKGRNCIQPPSIERVFTEIYLNNVWDDEESVSGRGSTLARTEVIRRELPALLKSIGAKSLLDAPCGDFNWMRHVDLSGVAYTGVDVVRELIARNRTAYEGPGRNFVALDIRQDRLPAADVTLCRDCLIHLSSQDAQAMIANVRRSGSTYLLATTHTSTLENTDIMSGDWRNINLRMPPYNFPEPLRQIVEDPELGKSLGMWRLEDLPPASEMDEPQKLP